LARHQRKVLSLMYAKHYSTRLWSVIKKSGKTFLAGCIAIVEAMSREGVEIVVVANDEEQSRSRVFATAVALCEKNPELWECVVRSTVNELGFSNGSVIRAIASDYRGAAGGRQFLVIFDELWGYSSENATRLFEELRPPPTEKGSYILIVSYAGWTGESTVLERLYQRALKGKRISRYEIYTSGGLCAFWSHVGRQPWQTKAFFEREEAELRPNQFRRLYRNEWVSGESEFLSAEDWDSIIDPNHSPILNDATVHVGVDLGVKNDSSAVAAVAHDPATKKIMMAFHRIWKPLRGRPVNLNEVKTYIEEINQRHRLMAVVIDPSQAYLLASQLAQKGITVKEFPQTIPNLTRMGGSLYSLVKDKNLIAYGAPDLREHILNCTALETPSGIRMVKTTGSRKIDAAVALSMAICSAIETGPRIANYSAVPSSRTGGLAVEIRRNLPGGSWHDSIHPLGNGMRSETPRYDLFSIVSRMKRGVK
jgi:phage terminase large subunit-like protein